MSQAYQVAEARRMQEFWKIYGDAVAGCIGGGTESNSIAIKKMFADNDHHDGPYYMICGRWLQDVSPTYLRSQGFASATIPDCTRAAFPAEIPPLTFEQFIQKNGGWRHDE